MSKHESVEPLVVCDHVEEDAKPTERKSREPTIFRVQEDIRKDDEAAYTPCNVSIGPYHWKKENPMEETPTFKSLRCFKEDNLSLLLLWRSRGDQGYAWLLERLCLEKLADLNDEIRSNYSIGNITPCNRQFARIMLSDGCFLIRMLLRHEDFASLYGFSNGAMGVIPQKMQKLIDADEEINRSFLRKESRRKSILYDFLKIENQIPLIVIKTLLDFLGLQLRFQLEEIVLKMFSELETIKYTIPTISPSMEYHHILHIFHSSLLPPTCKGESKANIIGPLEIWTPGGAELKRAGMKFKKRKDFISFLDINLNLNDGVVEIPPLGLVSKHREMLLRNLVIFEQDVPNIVSAVTVYIQFMRFLMRNEEDARVMKDAGIIRYEYGVIVDLFKFVQDISFSLKNNYLQDIILGIRVFRGRKDRTWMTTLREDHCRNPCSVIKIIASALGIIIVTIQTIYLVYGY